MDTVTHVQYRGPKVKVRKWATCRCPFPASRFRLPAASSAESVALPEGTQVRLTITPVDEDYDPLDAVIGICKGGPRDGAQEHDKYIYGDLRP